jgi:ribonuclease P protein component
MHAGRGMRVGLIVPRFKHSAVARNRLKRRLRELARLRMLPTGIPASVILRVRPDAYEATFDRLVADVDRAMHELQRWNESSVSAADTAGDTP